MAGNNWMDDRERGIRERDTRGVSDYGDRDPAGDFGSRDDERAQGYRAQDRRSQGYHTQYDEDRSWDTDDRPDMYAARRGGRERDRVFGERDTGAAYNRGWQDPAYRGVSPAMQRGDYRRTASRPMRPVGDTYGDESYHYGGRYYGDDGRETVYGEEYGAANLDDEFSPTRARYHAQGYGQPGYGGYRGYAGGYTDYRRDFDRPASGGTGGYDYERGYGDGGRGDEGRRAYDGRDMGDRMEHAGHDAGAFLRRTGRKVASWFNAGGEGAVYDDLTPGRRGGVNRGRGPQGYQRADDRINEDAHERLTDDPWLDASNISLSVSGGEVTLSGTVEHREAKHRAERIVEDISGVTHVQNNLRVVRGNYFTSPSSGYGDSVLGAQIRDAEAEGQTPVSSSTTNGGKKS